MEGLGFFELFTGLLAGLYAVVPSYGLAIILLVVLVRLVVLPLSIKSTRSMREMQLIQPEVKKIQAKHKGDRQKMNEALMALYKEHGVNPFGGCLPTIIQFALIIPLYWVIRTPLEYMGPVEDSALAHALRDTPLQVHQFLGIRLDCSSSAALGGLDPSNVGEACGSGFLSALPYLAIVVFVGLTAFYQQRQMQARSAGGQQGQQMQQMQTFMKIFPAILVFISFGLPSGLVIYFLTSNVWQIGQQRIMFKAAPPLTAGAQADGKGGKRSDAKPPGGKPAGRSPATRTAGDGQAKAKRPHPSSKKKKKR